MLRPFHPSLSFIGLWILNTPRYFYFAFDPKSIRHILDSNFQIDMPHLSVNTCILHTQIAILILILNQHEKQHEIWLVSRWKFETYKFSITCLTFFEFGILARRPMYSEVQNLSNDNESLAGGNSNESGYLREDIWLENLFSIDNTHRKFVLCTNK